MKLKKLLRIEALVLLIVIIGLLLLDFSLELGKFHGLVFSLYLLYGSGLIFVINALVSLYYYKKKQKQKSKSFIWTGIIIGLSGAMIAFIGGSLI